MEVLEELLASLERNDFGTEEDLVIDTTGSVVYTGKTLLHRLRKQTTVVHLSTPPQVQETLLRAYLRQGAIICGEPYWDAAFGVADVFVLLECDRITNRYTKHFIDRI